MAAGAGPGPTAAGSDPAVVAPGAAVARGSARPLALASLLVWVPHVIDLFRVGEGVHVLWICNLAGAVLTLGCLLERPALVGVGGLWLAFGTPLFLLSAFGGGEHQLTSWLSHFGGLAVAGVAIGRLGWSRAAWWLATLGQVTALGVARVATEPRENINLAHAVFEGWEDVFPSYAIYFVCLLALSVALYLALDLLLVRVIRPREPRP